MSNREPTEGELRALDAARHLAEFGVPLFLAPQHLHSKTGVWVPRGGSGFKPPVVDKDTGETVREARPGCGYILGNWKDRAKADPAVADRWRPGMALGAVMGVVNAVDVDLQNDGDRSTLDDVMPPVYGVAQTASGGTHELIAPLGLRNGSIGPGIDLKAEGGFIFLSPTRKWSKTEGKISVYRWTTFPNLDRLLLPSSSALLAEGQALRSHIVDNRGRRESAEYDGPPYEGPPHANLEPEQQAQAAQYLAEHVEHWEGRLRARADDDSEGAGDHGGTWGELARAFGFDLALMVACPWLPLTLTEARALYEQHLPEEIAAVDGGDRYSTWGPHRKGLLAKAEAKPVRLPPWQADQHGDPGDLFDDLPSEGASEPTEPRRAPRKVDAGPLTPAGADRLLVGLLGPVCKAEAAQRWKALRWAARKAAEAVPRGMDPARAVETLVLCGVRQGLTESRARNAVEPSFRKYLNESIDNQSEDAQ